jgi:protein O-GlcNAc transferase
MLLFAGSKQLQVLRKRLERNRLTMPLFDTKGWVRDFEKALKIQWEIYANGLSPMHIVVARSDRLYGTEVII